jgi:hypothetical protein
VLFVYCAPVSHPRFAAFLSSPIFNFILEPSDPAVTNLDWLWKLAALYKAVNVGLR